MDKSCQGTDVALHKLEIEISYVRRYMERYIYGDQNSLHALRYRIR